MSKQVKDENKHLNVMSRRVCAYRYLALFGHLGLLIWMSVWYLFLPSSTNYSITFIIVIYLLPLILPLYGIIRAKPYTHAWSCFVVLWYFLHAITVIYAEPSYWVYATIELIFAVMMFYWVQYVCTIERARVRYWIT